MAGSHYQPSCRRRNVSVASETHKGSHVERDTVWGDSAGKDTKGLSFLPFSLWSSPLHHQQASWATWMPTAMLSFRQVSLWGREEGVSGCEETE